MVGVPWQVMELLDEGDAVAATALGWLGYECLVGKMTHMLFEVFDFIRQQEGVRHETVINGEEALQSTDYDTKDVLLCEVLS